MDLKKYYVEIFRVSDKHVETRMGPMGHSEACRVQRGAMINMDLHNWSVRIISAHSQEE